VCEAETRGTEVKRISTRRGRYERKDLRRIKFLEGGRE